jgi:hypothetical protein
MHRNPQTAEEWKSWLTRRQVMAAIHKLRPCRFGHLECSTHSGGPCFSAVLRRISEKARIRALQLVASGSDGAMIWGTISREYPTLDQSSLETVVEAALSYSKA